MSNDKSYFPATYLWRPLYQYEQQDTGTPEKEASTDEQKSGDSLDDAIKLIRQKTNLLKDSIIEIKLQVEERRRLASAVKETLDRLIWKNREKLLKIERILGTNNPVAFERRTELEKEINRMDGEKLNVEVQLWQDITVLQREMREIVREYKEAIKAELIE